MQNHPKRRLWELSQTLPRFWDQAKVFREPHFSKNHPIPLSHTQICSCQIASVIKDLKTKVHRILTLQTLCKYYILILALKLIFQKPCLVGRYGDPVHVCGGLPSIQDTSRLFDRLGISALSAMYEVSESASWRLSYISYLPNWLSFLKVKNKESFFFHQQLKIVI